MTFIDLDAVFIIIHKSIAQNVYNILNNYIISDNG